MAEAEEHEIRAYLLGQLTEEDDEQVEVRLLTEPDFAEEYDMVVNEVTDDYIAGKFEGEELKNVEEYFFKSRERRNKLKFALALKRRKSEIDADKRRTKSWFKPYLAIAAAVVLLAVGGFYLWRAMSANAELNKGLAALQSAYRDERPLEARISKFDYAPYLTTRGREPDKIDQDALRRAELTLLDAVKKNPTPAVHHGLGKVYLAKREFDKAIEEFDEGLKGDSKNAQIYSDLGAAWLEKGKIDREGKEPGQGMEELGRSLENLNNALQLDGSLLEALFNRALCHQYMMQPSLAEADWRVYLEKDSRSPWADEGRRQLKILEDQDSKTSQRRDVVQDFLSAYNAGKDQVAAGLLGENYTSAGNLITNSLLDGYLKSRSEGKFNEADQSVKLLAYVGQLETRKGDDHFTVELARFYGSLAPARTAVLLQARADLKKGYENFTNSRLNEAIGNYTAARNIYDRLGDETEAAFAEYRVAHCYVLQPNIAKAKPILERLIPIFEAKNYHWLLSQCFFGIANIELDLSQYSQSIESANRSLLLSEKVGDVNGLLKNLIQLADKYQTLNEPLKSLGLLQRGLVLTRNASVEPTQVWGTYIAIAFNFNSLGLHTAALGYQDEALRLAKETNRPLLLSRTYEYIGLTYRELKKYEEAITQTQLALDIGNSLSDDPNGLNMVAHASLQLGDILRESGDYQKAIDTYNRSLRLYDQLDFEYYSYVAHKGRLLSYLALADDNATERELKTVLALFEGNRSRINEEANRNSFFEMEESVFDLAIDFAYSKKKDPQLAFESSEQSRARSLKDMTLQGAQLVAKEDGPDLYLKASTNFLSVASIQSEMPEQAQILQYSVLDDKVLIWVVSKTHISSEVIETDIETLNQKIRLFLRGVSSASGSRSPETAKANTDLYSILIQPIERFLDDQKVLCIVPDKLLNYLPFSALISPASGKYLIERYQLELAPSSSMFLICSASARQRSGIKRERLLSIGNPSFDRAAYPFLADLPSAAREAEAIAKYYPSAIVFLGDNARRSSVAKEFEKSDVVHLALHYVTNETSSLLSKLVLARDSSATGSISKSSDDALPIYEIYGMTLSRSRLVVLSTCESGIERQYRGEGPISAARPFIAKGVPLVVASLWKVDSDSTTQLMINFHRHRKLDGLPSVEALRRAQRDMLADKDPRYRDPYYWASFVTIGGYAEF
jgi:CHAT domain-containing protein